MSERTTGESPPHLIGEVLAVTVLAWVISLLLFKFGRNFSFLESYGPLLAIAPLIYLPLVVILLRQEPLARYGLTFSSAGRALGLTALAIVIVFPPFALGFQTYGQGLFSLESPRVRSPFGWVSWLLHTPYAWSWLLQSLLIQFCFVALPEEFFYRGYLQARLNALFFGRCRLFGTRVGAALLVTSALFALHHFLINPLPQRLLVFFPALLFSWLREVTGSLLAPGLFHASCNVYTILLTKASEG
ncbi:MAG: CPBP family intramembrane metalloprotease [Candidatus Rokubacteria bacterium]|nr:CPBP family intramembrane metalloprotease [Candidatus Rokubacteria bacterium]